MSDLLTIAEVSALLSAREKPLSDEAVKRYVRVGASVRGSARRVLLRCVRVPGGTKFLRSDVEKFVRELNGRRVVLQEPVRNVLTEKAKERKAQRVPGIPGARGEYPPVMPGRGVRGAGRSALSLSPSPTAAEPETAAVV